jgi:hypothetical protein
MISNRCAALGDGDDVDNNRGRKIIREIMEASATESLGYYESKSIIHVLVKGDQNHWIKRSKLNCSGYII